MKPHVTPHLLKRLGRIEEKGRGIRTVAEWPKMMGVDEWSALAMPMQAKLIAEARDEHHGQSVVTVGRDLADATERYRPSIPHPVDTTPLEEKVLTERQQYAAALAQAAGSRSTEAHNASCLVIALPDSPF